MPLQRCCLTRGSSRSPRRVSRTEENSHLMNVPCRESVSPCTWACTDRTSPPISSAKPEMSLLGLTRRRSSCRHVRNTDIRRRSCRTDRQSDAHQYLDGPDGRARTCYDHLARLGVAFTGALVRHKHLRLVEDGGTVTPPGRNFSLASACPSMRSAEAAARFAAAHRR